MASYTTDSGTETLFSDDSACGEMRSPSSICSGDDNLCHRNSNNNNNNNKHHPHHHNQSDDGISISSRLAPPNIQPYSGVLEKGKVVIRPKAFRPTTSSAMNQSTKFSDRYSSTPILTRPGSVLTLYGSTSDLPLDQNYSLDRRLRSSRTSTTSSSPLEMSSLPSIPHGHKLINYNSFENVRKSPNSNGGNKDSYRSSTSNMVSFLDLTPSPSDSGVSELEAALRDRDSELAYLRETMECNEKVIIGVYQEKEKVWEKEFHRLKAVHENRLRTSAQKALKLEQMLMMQSYQLNQEKKRLMGEVQRTNFQNEKFKQEMTALRTRLEETEWGLCQKTGEISLLKTQLKECQSEQTARYQEILQLKMDYKELQQQYDEIDDELEKQKTENTEKTNEIADMKIEIESLKCQLKKYESMDSIDKTRYEDITQTERLKAEIKELREELSDLSLNDYSNIQPGRIMRSTQNFQKVEDEVSLEDLEIQQLNGEYIEHFQETNEIARLRKELEIKNKEFEKEKLIWTQEKEKVLRYQKRLQMNYVNMYKRCKSLEGELENLTLEIAMDNSELNNCGQIAKAELVQTIEI